MQFLRCNAFAGVFSILLMGCSNGTNTSTEVDTSCKNVITYELSGSTPLTGTYHYDDFGHIQTYVETSADGTELFRLSRTYDERERLIGQIVDTIRFNDKHREMTWEYDDQNRISRATYDGWGMTEVFRDTRIVYDAQSRRDEMTTTENGKLVDYVDYVYTEGEPLIVEERHYSDADKAILAYGFRYFLAQNRWLERSEVFHAETIESAEWFLYDDMSKGMVARREFDFDADNILNEVDGVSWNASGFVKHTEFDLDANGTVDQTNDYHYDVLGRLTLRTWKVLDQGNLEFVTKFDWSDQGLTHVERLDGLTGQFIEKWSSSYGCPRDWPMNVPISPIHGFRYEAQTLPFNVDASTWWTSFEML